MKDEKNLEMKCTTITIKLTERMRDDLKLEAIKSDQSIGRFLRGLIKNYFKKGEKK